MGERPGRGGGGKVGTGQDVVMGVKWGGARTW